MENMTKIKDEAYTAAKEILKKDTGWKQDIKMEQTIKDMLEYWRKQL